MAKKEEIIEEVQFLSDRLSTQIRYIVFGILATVWGFYISDHLVIKLAVSKFSNQLIWLMILSTLVLVIDYLQYLSGYLIGTNLIKQLEKSSKNEGAYDEKSLGYRFRIWAFVIKQIFAGINIVIFLWVLFNSFNK